MDLVVHLTGKFEDRSTELVVETGVSRAIGPLLRTLFGTSLGPNVAVVTDRRVGDLYAAPLIDSLGRAGFRTAAHTLEPGEGSKCLAELEKIYSFLMEQQVGRDGLVLALGGGVVSDVAGFAAATWMRGIDWAVCPTTLEAMIDAAIGGKTAVNLPGGKNLVGAFHPPRLVAIDPVCLRTLDPRDLRAGLAESVKHALIASPELFAWHERHARAILARDDRALMELIEPNVRIKLDIVARDPFERTGERILLNFGHTIGHAIEECSGYTLRHGESVALGMLAACRLSHSSRLLDRGVVDRVLELLTSLELPTRLESAPDAASIMRVLRRDKKAHASEVRFVLLEDIGRPVVRAVAADEIERAYLSLC